MLPSPEAAQDPIFWSVEPVLTSHAHHPFERDLMVNIVCLRYVLRGEADYGAAFSRVQGELRVGHQDYALTGQ